MFTIELKVNDTKVGNAIAINTSPDIRSYHNQEYMVTAWTDNNPVNGKEGYGTVFKIEGHDRNQSVWSLVERIAREMREQEK